MYVTLHSWLPVRTTSGANCVRVCMYVYQTIYRSSVGCMCTWWIPEVGYTSYMYTMYRYINMDLLVKDRMVAEYLDSCIHCTFSKKKKFPNEGLVFSIIIFFSVGNSYSKIDPSDQVKQEKKKKTRKGNTSGLFVQKCWSGSQPTLPCKYYPTLCG